MSLACKCGDGFSTIISMCRWGGIKFVSESLTFNRMGLLLLFRCKRPFKFGQFDMHKHIAINTFCESNVQYLHWAHPLGGLTNRSNEVQYDPGKFPSNGNNTVRVPIAGKISSEFHWMWKPIDSVTCMRPNCDKVVYIQVQCIQQGNKQTKHFSLLLLLLCKHSKFKQDLSLWWATKPSIHVYSNN